MFVLPKILTFQRWPYILLWLCLLAGALSFSDALLQAQVKVNAPQPPPQPSQSKNRGGGGTADSSQATNGNVDPSFPQLELVEAPLQAPRALQGGVFGRSELLYRKFILEVFSGYYASMLSLYNIDASAGNSNGNTRESDWNNLYNLIVGAQVSGNIRKFHYSAWFAIPFNLGADNIQLRNYEYGLSTISNRNNDISYQGTFQSTVSYIFMGGLKAGTSIVDRKSAKLILGGGLDGFLGQWELHGGDDIFTMVLNTPTNQHRDFPDSRKTVTLFTGHILPFVYLQGGVFLTPFLEILASVGYSPATMWFSEENRIVNTTEQTSDAPTQYRRYGYFGQTILGEFQARLWISRRFAIKLGVKGRYTLKTAGNLRTYELDTSGELVDSTIFTLTTNGGAMEMAQFSAFLGIGMTFDKNLPPGRKYVMPF